MPIQTLLDNVANAPRQSSTLGTPQIMTTQREGWLDNEYIRVYAEGDRERIAELYAFETFLPCYIPIASWGLDALVLAPDSCLYLIDWIPLAESFRREKYTSIAEFAHAMRLFHEADPGYEHYRKEIHLKHPLALGGSPQEHPVMLDQQTHAEACRFFNDLYRHLETKTKAQQ